MNESKQATQIPSLHQFSQIPKKGSPLWGSHIHQQQCCTVEKSPPFVWVGLKPFPVMECKNKHCIPNRNSIPTIHHNSITGGFRLWISKDQDISQTTLDAIKMYLTPLDPMKSPLFMLKPHMENPYHLLSGPVRSIPGSLIVPPFPLAISIACCLMVGGRWSYFFIDSVKKSIIKQKLFIHITINHQPSKDRILTTTRLLDSQGDDQMTIPLGHMALPHVRSLFSPRDRSRFDHSNVVLRVGVVEVTSGESK